MANASTMLSLAMIVRDAETTLERILRDAAMFCDELVVVDTGSTDQTVELAKSLGAQVFYFPWCDDFSAARNAAFSHCTGDWIIWLDADDVISPEQQLRFKALKETQLNDQLDVVCCTYQTDFDEQNQPIFSCLRERLIRRTAGLRWEGAVHEYIADWAWRPFIWREDLVVEHRPLSTDSAIPCDRNLRILEAILARGDRTPRNLFYYGNELRDHQRTAEAIAIYEEFLALAPERWESYEARINLVSCHQTLGQAEAALAETYRAMALNPARAEAFNSLGMHYVAQEKWEQALPFFVAATVLKKPKAGFACEDDYTWLPYYYLCLCYLALGEREKALEYARQAAEFPIISQEALDALKVYLHA